MDDEAKVTRRYKLLMREKERLTKAGRIDEDIEEELRKIAERFPAIADRPVPPLQASTAAMLALGEAVHEEEKVASGAAPPSTEHQAQQAAIPPTVSNPREERQMRTVGSKKAPCNDSSAESPSDPPKNHNRSFLLRLIPALSLFLRLWNDLLVARPKVGAVSLAKCLAVAFLSAIIHFHFADRCGAGMVCDPFLYWAAVNGSAMIKSKTISSFERVLVFILRDGIGSFCAVLVTYSVTDSTLAVLGTRILDSC
jgi:hypothetical protein